MKKILSWIALGIGAVVTLDGMIRIPSIFNFRSFWNYPKLMLLIIFLAGMTIAAWMFKGIIQIFMKQLKTNVGVRLYIWLLVLYALFLVMLFLLRLPNPFTPLASFWLQGKKGILLKVSDIFIHFIVIPIILFDLIISIYAKIKNTFPQWSVSENILLNYNRSFIAVLVVAGLASFFMSPEINISNIGNTIGGSEWLKEAYASIRYSLGDQFFDVTLAARNHWFVYIGEDSLDDYQNTQPYSPQDIAFIQDRLDQLSDYLTSKGIKLIVVIPPNKNTIYPQYMPPQIPVIGSQSRLDQLVAYEKDHGKVKVMDLRADLLQASKKYLTYYPCGTHWNYYGAFIAYQDIMTSLEKDYPNLKPHGLNEYRLTNNLVGATDLANLVHLDHSPCSGSDVYLEPLYRHQVVTEQYWIPTDVTALNFISPMKITTVNADSSLPRLLMYRDSFTNWLIPFLSDHFSQAVYLWAFPTDELYNDVALEKPDVVIIEFTERYINFLSMILSKKN